jgi:hypothetical protein
VLCVIYLNLELAQLPSDYDYDYGNKQDLKKNAQKYSIYILNLSEQPAAMHPLMSAIFQF